VSLHPSYVLGRANSQSELASTFISCSHLVLFFLLPAFAYNITTKLNQNDRPAPGFVMFVDIEFQPDEPTGVDMLLFNGNLGNTTALLRRLLLTNNNNLGFTIPFVPPG
jgi:hypothetical protein